MKRFFITAWVFLLLLSLQAQEGRFFRGEVWRKAEIRVKDADFFISPQGNDAWSGMLAEPDAAGTDGPFRTLVRAQRAVRELKKKVYRPKEKPSHENYIGSPHPLGSGKDILVLIREGYYPLDTTLVFTPADGGERVETNQPSGAWEFHKLKDHFVTWAAYPGEHPVISGGVPIQGWKRSGTLWTASVAAPVDHFIAGGRKQILARTPNSGMYTAAKASPSPEAFFFRDGEVQRWTGMEGNRPILYLRWHMAVNSIAAVDEKMHLATLQHPDAGITVIRSRYYIENVRALLDTAGEWFWEKNKKELLWMPPVDVTDPNGVITAVSRLTALVRVEGDSGRPVRNLRFYGLTFEATRAGDYALTFHHSSYCEVVECRLQALGGSGILLGKGAFETRILENDFDQIDKNGVILSGDPRPKDFSDIIRQNTIAWNRMNDIGQHFGNVIRADNTLYTTIAHNEISNNKGRYPIYVGGWANAEEALEGGYRVEYNHLHHVQSRSDDSGVITTGGYTHNSVIRRNLIHDVHKGMFNDNVAIWFDNLSKGWTAEENVFYNLQQGEMKLCAANLTDNLYRDNYLIEAPAVPPEVILTGDPFYTARQPRVMVRGEEVREVVTGRYVEICSVITNTGSSGVGTVTLCINGQQAATEGLALIRHNRDTVCFRHRFARPGTYRITVKGSPYTDLTVLGDTLHWFCDNLWSAFDTLPEDDSLLLTATVTTTGEATELPLMLYDHGKKIGEKMIRLGRGQKKTVFMKVLLPAGNHELVLGNSNAVRVYVFPHRPVDLSRQPYGKYCSARAHPCEVVIDRKGNQYMIKAAGTDFFHGEDSYATAYLEKPVKGNFVATVKVVRYGPHTHEWFRTGLFVRNDITKSYDTGAGSLGSVLLFVSPGRAGMDWDEHGDGCMHKASSQNHPRYEPVPMWLRLVRHGDSFSGYVSYDGVHWTVERHTGDIPGIKEAVHLGLAAGAPDEKPYKVWFEDFELEVEK